jgi:hypothetical protein
MFQYSLLGRTAASTRFNTTFRGLAPSPSSGKTDLTYSSSFPCFSTCLFGHYKPVWFSLPRQVEKHGTDELYVKSVLPEDGDGTSPRNVVFNRVDAAVRPRRLNWKTLYLHTLYGYNKFVEIFLFLECNLFPWNGVQSELRYWGTHCPV